MILFRRLFDAHQPSGVGVFFFALFISRLIFRRNTVALGIDSRLLIGNGQTECGGNWQRATCFFLLLQL